MSTIPAPPKTQRPCSRARPRRLRVRSGVVCTGTVPNAAPGWPRLPDFWPALQRVGAGRRGRPPLSPAGARVARASWPWAQGPSLFLGSKVLVMLTTHPGTGAEGDSSGVRERSSPTRPRGGGRGRRGHPGGLPGGGGRQWARASCRSWWSTTSATRSRRASSSWTPRSSTPTSLGNARPPRPPAGPQVMPTPTWPTVLSWRCAPLPASHPQALTAHPPLRKAFRGAL